eukprot:756599-Hanusia_phi.AAC.2
MGAPASKMAGELCCEKLKCDQRISSYDQEESESPLHRIAEDDDGCAIVLTKRNRSEEREFSCKLLSRAKGQRCSASSSSRSSSASDKTDNGLESTFSDIEIYDTGRSLSVFNNIDRSLYPARIDLHGRTTPNKNCSFFFQNSRVPLTKFNTHTLGKYAEKVQCVDAENSGLLM